MNKLSWLIAGAAATALYIYLNNTKQTAQSVPVVDLAHKLQDAWADHHTVA
jgi:hypothetical protein